MRALWWALKLFAGLVLVGCLLSIALAAVFPGFMRSAAAWLPGLPLLPWTHVTGLALEPPRPDPDRSQRLVLQLRSLPEQPSGLRALWRAALPGASFTRHSVSLPLPTLRKPTMLLDAAHALWSRHGLLSLEAADCGQERH